jgi:hypothetical protein
MARLGDVFRPLLVELKNRRRLAFSTNRLLLTEQRKSIESFRNVFRKGQDLGLKYPISARECGVSFAGTE